MAQERRLNLRFSPERFDQIDEKRFKLRASFQEIGTQLFEEWLNGEREVTITPPTPKPDPLIEKLEIIRASGDAELIAMVKKAVEVTYGLLQHSLTPEDIQHLRTAANNHAGVAGLHRGTGGAGEEVPRDGKKRTRKSA
jgi:hypothetical protein